VSARWTDQDYADYQARKGVKGVLVSTEIRAREDGELYVHHGHAQRIVVPGEPIAKPRQTRSDKWKERPCVVRYREWADRARAAVGAVPSQAQHADIIIYLPLPQSLSAKKRSAMAGTPHRVKPDIDNLVKSALDALLKRDQGIYELRAKKFWEDKNGPRVEITLY
jgi:Holliday junction resolvase RusA-like endonuclease